MLPRFYQIADFNCIEPTVHISLQCQNMKTLMSFKCLVQKKTRPAEAMGRTEQLSSADDTDSTEELNIPTYAQRLDALLTSESEQSLNESYKCSDKARETTKEHSSTSDEEKGTCDSIKLIFSALKKRSYL